MLFRSPSIIYQFSSLTISMTLASITGRSILFVALVKIVPINPSSFEPTTEAICPDTLAAMACISRWFWESASWPSFSMTREDMVGAAGISAFPMSSRVIEKLGQEADSQNHLLMHAIAANVSGQIASVVAGGVVLQYFANLG